MQMKKILGILLVLCFVLSVTAVAASAHEDHDWYHDHGNHWYNDHFYDDNWYSGHGYHWYNNHWYDDNWWNHNHHW
jgi:hypothetical protein